MMAHWLLKTEPHKYSWDDLVGDGRTVWDGVRNHQAAINLRAMAVGDEVLIYHSNEGKQAVGIARIARGHFIDPSDEAGKFPAVEVEPVRPLARPVTLAALKADPAFADLALIRQSRLSVVPVGDAHWDAILELGGEGPGDRT